MVKATQKERARYQLLRQKLLDTYKGYFDTPLAPSSCQKSGDESTHPHAKPGTEENTLHRWDSLYPALLKPTRHAALLNTFHGEPFFKQPTPSTLTSTSPPGADQPRNDEAIQDKSNLDPPQQHIVPDLLEDATPWLPSTTCLRLYHLPQQQSHSSKDYLLPPPSKNNTHNLKNYYCLDFASIFPVLALDPQPNDTILDMTAAPGGKTLTMLNHLAPSLPPADNNNSTGSTTISHFKTRLHVNELDFHRRKRLRLVLDEYIPPHLLPPPPSTSSSSSSPSSSSIIQIMGKDATLDSSFRPLTYDKILLDAPCSSERHVLHQLHKQDSASNLHKDLLNWSPSSSDKIAKNLQLKMLINAVNALKFGGSLVYSTCSLSPSENDGVVENMLKAIDKQNRKRVKEAAARRQRRNAGDAHDEDLEDSHQQQEAEPEEQGTRAQPTDDQEPQPELWKVEVVPTSWSIGEPTTHGWMILPDQQQGAGWGPIYFCKIVKRRKKRQGLS
ncbi:hypothetical protein LTR67_006560 [Exophiala xenobiotica]